MFSWTTRRHAVRSNALTSGGSLATENAQLRAQLAGVGKESVTICGNSTTNFWRQGDQNPMRCTMLTASRCGARTSTS